VVLTSGGYPGKFENGKQVDGLTAVEQITGVKVLHAGTNLVGDAVVTNGGRVLGVTASARTIEAALASAYEAASGIHFEGMHYRKDIGAHATQLKAAGIRDMPRVQNLFRAPKKQLPMEELSEVRAVGDTGFEGCAHARPGASARFCSWIVRPWRPWTSAGNYPREHYTDGLNVNSLQIGQQLAIGEARLEVSAVCNPCDQMEAIRPGLRKELWGGAACCAAFGGGVDSPRRFHRKAFLTIRAWAVAGVTAHRAGDSCLPSLFRPAPQAGHPFEAVVLIHRAENKRRAPSDQGQHGAHKIGGIDRSSLLRLAAIDVFQHLGKTRLTRTEMRDVRVVALD